MLRLARRAEAAGGRSGLSSKNGRPIGHFRDGSNSSSVSSGDGTKPRRVRGRVALENLSLYGDKEDLQAGADQARSVA